MLYDRRESDSESVSSSENLVVIGINLVFAVGPVSCDFESSASLQLPGPVPFFSESLQFQLNLILDTSVFNAISKADYTAAFKKSLEFCF